MGKRIPRLTAIASFSAATIGIWLAWGPMAPLFMVPHSTVLLDREGGLLCAVVASDGQWRMPHSTEVPTRFERCLLEFEDRHFHQHFGVHLPSLVRAWRQNRAAGRIVSGGSTITMQVARMSAGRRERTWSRKLGEVLQALRIELRHSKREIMALYASNAPFGGNVVGLEAASWRWFGRPPDELSWAESATLAVLPNAPAKLHPGRNREALRDKRNRLLARLLTTGDLNPLEWELACAEPLPDEPHDLPRKAPHLLTTLQRRGFEGQRIRSTIDHELQDRVTRSAASHGPALRANEVHNLAVLVLDVPTGEVLAYVGNLASAGALHAGDVDVVQARRSTGSLLKPFLYAAMLQDGTLAPDQLVADLPTHYEGFAPRNFTQRYDGAVPASQALARSLNVPAVRALHEHGVDRTLRLLRAMGLHHVDRSADDYGLSLMVGGAESTLWELTGAYASLARILSERGSTGTVHPPVVQSVSNVRHEGAPPLSAAAVYHTVRALQYHDRPEDQAGWQHFAGSAPIAWKTGTSFGHRDAWAIGITDRYAIGVWCGNASGEGRPGLTGSLAAAPLLFDLFALLPAGQGFDLPYDDMHRMAVCRSSGYRAGPDCLPVDTNWIIHTASGAAPCPYHKRILVNTVNGKRTRPKEGTKDTSWFVLPPAMEHYFVATHPSYRPLPPWEPDVEAGDERSPIDMIYPQNGSRIHVPVMLDGVHGRVVLHAAHADAQATLHWDVDGEYLGTTLHDHRLTVDLQQGDHRLTLTDDRGYALPLTFLVERGRSPGQ